MATKAYTQSLKATLICSKMVPKLGHAASANLLKVRVLLPLLTASMLIDPLPFSFVVWVKCSYIVYTMSSDL